MDVVMRLVEVMSSWEEQVYAQEGQYNEEETGDSQKSCIPSPPVGEVAEDQIGPVEEPSHQRPHFFGVPDPPTPPHTLRPEGTAEYACAKQYETQNLSLIHISEPTRRTPISYA